MSEVQLTKIRRKVLFLNALIDNYHADGIFILIVICKFILI